MNRFRESDLTFIFPDDWIVRKFDETPAYRSLAGHGLKGVDFICLTPDRELWLIEVKNYRRRAHTDKWTGPKRSAVQLANHVYRKFSDTLRLVGIANRWIARRWYRRLGAHYPSSTYWFWREVARADCTICLLWLPLPDDQTTYAGDVSHHLSEKIRTTLRDVEFKLTTGDYFPIRAS